VPRPHSAPDIICDKAAAIIDIRRGSMCPSILAAAIEQILPGGWFGASERQIAVAPLSLIGVKAVALTK
jgi:hypothetical protein